MTWPKRLELGGWGPKFEGVGDKLTLVMGCRRPNPSRTDPDLWRGEVRVRVDRWFVRQLCQAIADMQAADRVRINEEFARLSTEVAPLTKPTKEPT